MVHVGAWTSAVEWCRRLSWRSLRIPALFLVSVALLTLMYRLRSDRIDKEEAEKASSKVNLLAASVKVLKSDAPTSPATMTLWPDEADLSELASHERWAVISGTEGEEEDYGIGAGERWDAKACSLAAAVESHGWRPIVIGEGLKCCRLPDCVPMDTALLSRLPYRVLRFLQPPPAPAASRDHRLPPTIPPPPHSTPPHPSALRNAAFLFAIQHGARFVFDAYPPKGGDIGSLTSWADEVFSSVVLGTSVGLVLDGHSFSFPTSVPGAPSPRVLNPYSHFGRSDLWAKGYDVFDGDEHQQHHLRYRVCEIRQPSLEMFLDVWDGGPADLVAPPITVPSGVLAPYGSKNILYTRDAFWGLALFPDNNGSSPRLSPNLARALWNHALLGATLDAGGVRFNLMPGTKGFQRNGNVSLERILSDEKLPISAELRAYVATFTSRALRWRCRSTTLLPCLSQLVSDFLATSLLTQGDAAFMEAWVTDLRRVRYLPPPTLPWSPRPPPRPPGPCIHPPHHHHRQSHDPPLPHPTTLTFHPIRPRAPTTAMPSSVRMLIARFNRDAALLEWSAGEERTREEVALVEETLVEDGMFSDKDSKGIESSSRIEVGTEDEEDGASSKMPPSEGVEEETTDHPLSQEVASTRTFLGDVADHLCPGFAPLASPLLSHRPSTLGFRDVLLVVWFPRPPRYDLLPTLELLRSRHFPNALFCGPPHRALPSMLSRFEGLASPSFLTATSRSDCLLTALEMGYRLGEEGSLLLVEESALPVPWSLSARNRSLLWFYEEKEEVATEEMSVGGDTEEGKESRNGGEAGERGRADPKPMLRSSEDSVIVAAEGLASALRFMARLMGVRPNPHLHPHHHQMEEAEHEEGAPWNGTPANVSDVSNATESVSPKNDTSLTTEAIPEVENSTLIESTLIVARENSYNNNGSEYPAVVEEVEISELEESNTPAVEHVDTPSVEYSEPTIIEYVASPTTNERTFHHTDDAEHATEKKAIPTMDDAATAREKEVILKDDVDTAKKGDIASPIEQSANITVEENSDSLKEEGEESKVDDIVDTTTDRQEHSDKTIEDHTEMPCSEDDKSCGRDKAEHDGVEHVSVEHVGVEHVGVEHVGVEHVGVEHVGVEHVDTPAIEYSEPPVEEHAKALEIDPFSLESIFDHYEVEKENGTAIEDTNGEEKAAVAETSVIINQPAITSKHEESIGVEVSLHSNDTAIPWNDTDTKFEIPAQNVSSDWVTSADAEEILSSVTLIENTPDNSTEESKGHEEVNATEYFADYNTSRTHPSEDESDRNESSFRTQAFEIKSSELYEDEKHFEDPLGDEEQSLLSEPDELLSYKEDTPQFIGLPSSASKSHPKTEGADVPDAEGRAKREASYWSNNGEQHNSTDSYRDFFSKTKEPQDEGSDDFLQGVSLRLGRSLREIQELLMELASGFPEDSEAVLREKGVPEAEPYPNVPHYGLDHTDFRHLHCDYGEMEEDGAGDWGEADGKVHFEPCVALRRFFLRIHHSHDSESALLGLLSLATARGSAPIFHLPIRLQRELHLTASMLLSQGFPEEAVLPLLVYGLGGNKGWVNLRKGSFGNADPSTAAFPSFNQSSDFIYPSNLRMVPEEPRLRSAFCLKFLLRVLDG